MFRILFVALVVAIFGMATNVSAHHQGDVWWYLESSATRMLAMRQSGEWPWRYSEDCAGGNIYPAVKGSIDYTAGLFGIYTPELAGGQLNRSTCGAAFSSRCGAGFAVACVGADSPGFPANCDATYNGPYMAIFVWWGQHAVVKHELMHCMAVRAEGYDDVNGACIPADSIMGCGPNHPSDYSERDFAAWALVHYPEPLTEFGTGENESGFYIFWGFAPETTPGDTGSPATRIAILYDDGNGPYWSGVHAPLAKLGKYQGWHVQTEPGRCYFAKVENEISWAFALTERLVGCT